MIYPFLAFFFILFAGSFETGSLNRPFAVLLAGMSYITFKKLPEVRMILKPLAVALFVFAALDMFKIIPSIIPSDEYMGGMLRRPAIIQPNLLAAYVMLLPHGWWTPLVTLITTSRGAFIGWCAAWFAQRHPVKAWAIVGGFLIILAGAFIVYLRLWTIAARFEIYIEAVRLFIERPLFGWGTGSYPSITRLAETYTAHNALLTIAAENGIIGLAGALFFVTKVISFARKSTSPARWQVLAFAVQQLVDDQWADPFAALLLGACLSEVTDA